MQRVVPSILGFFLDERERWLLWLPVGLGFGIAVYFALPIEPVWWAGLFATTGVLMLGIALRRRTAWLALSLLLGVMAVGFTMAQWRTARVAAPVLHGEVSLRPVSGWIQEIAVKPEGSKLILERLSIERLPAEATPSIVSISLRGYDASLSSGDHVSLRAGLFPPPSPSLPGAFDFARHFYFRQIGGVGYGVGEITRLEEGSTTAWRHRIADWRRQLTEHIRVRMDEPYGVVAAAFITGETAAIPDSVNETMRAAGLSHILAVSGMNLALVSAIVFFMLRAGLALWPYLALRVDAKKIAALLSLLLSLAYLAISGWPVSAQRAFVMIALLLIAVMLDREATPMRSLAWAATILLLIEPESLLGAGFQLSFAATIALIAAYETLQPRLSRLLDGRTILLYVSGILLSALIAGLATAPFTLYHFQQLSSYGLLANMAVEPLVSFLIMPLAVLGMVLLPFGLDRLAWWPMQWGVKWMLDVASFVQQMPEAALTLPPMPLWGILLVSLGGLWLCFWRKRWRCWGGIPILLGLASIGAVTLPDVLIGPEGKQVAVALEGKGSLVLLKGRKDQFVAQQWLRYFGQAAFLPQTEADPLRVACDKAGCVFHKAGQEVSLVKKQEILAEECGGADAVIADFALRGLLCAGPKLVISRDSLPQSGAVALWLESGGIHRQNARDVQGERPWRR